MRVRNKGVGEALGQNTVHLMVPDGTKLGRAQSLGSQGIDDMFRVNRPDVDYVKSMTQNGSKLLCGRPGAKC